MNINQLNQTVEYLKNEGVDLPYVGIVLGTGLGHLASRINVIKEFAYDTIPNFPVSTVESHAGKLIYGTIADKKVLAMQGRFHYYEGYSMEQIAFPIRVMKLLGIKILLLSNAAGCLNINWQKGDLMLLDDHINMLPGNPLIGKNNYDFGPRFPDMSAPYNKSINQKLTQLAKENNIQLREGVYVAVTGPMLETRAEYRFLHRIGADAVGMSTVPEVITANHMNLPCAAISVLTDECNPDDLQPVNIDQIIAVASKAEVKLSDLYCNLIAVL